MSAAGKALAHDSAAGHVSGSAWYVDDIPEQLGTLQAAVALSPVAHGRIRKLDLAPAMASPGVRAVASAATVPGNGCISPSSDDEHMFCGDTVMYVGQAIYAVAADTLHAARVAARAAIPDIKPLPALLTIEQALASRSYVMPRARQPVVQRNWQADSLDKCPHVLKGQMRNGGQEHFYLESQAAYALPQENGRMLVHSSTQHPAEVQQIVAAALGLPSSAVEVRVRRMGGAFGGKETQAAQPAAIAALLAQVSGRPVKLRLPRADDFRLSGKRHPFLGRYRIGFDDTGRILAADMVLAADCGCSLDLSHAIVSRALMHSDNAYYLPKVRVRGYACRTNKASNTAFRGFGGPQGMLLIERAIEDIADHLDLDPLAVRQRNLYRGTRQKTPYHQTVSDNILPQLVRKLAGKSRYASRRKAVASYNRGSAAVKKGIALTPAKFGISFTTEMYNQAGALVHIYRDGSVAINHGGTEMGQGLYRKVEQIAADSLGVPLQTVRTTTTTTHKVPNTSATAASAGTDLNGKAVENAALTLRGRLARHAAGIFGCKPAAVRIADGVAAAGRKSLPFAELVELAYRSRVQLSSTGFYATPQIHWDPATSRGRPFYYFAYGAAVSEVAIDVYTGAYRLLRVDILHDVGRSINPAIDIGQIEGGYAQGCGWLTSEEVSWDEQGRLRETGPATYKIPAAGDMPADFNVELWPQANRVDSVYRSKAVGEPPLMLAFSAWAALADAASAAAGVPVGLDAPATPERVLLAIETARNGR